VRQLAAVISMVVLVAGCAVSALPARAQGAPLSALFPPGPEGGSSLTVAAEGMRTLEEHAATFSDPGEAVRLLLDWGWQENAFQFIEDARASNEEATAPYLYMSVTRFAGTSGAAAALPYIVQDLAAAEGHQEIPLSSPVGDEARALVVSVDGGTDYTLYVRSGALILRISVLLGDSDSIADPEQVAEEMIARTNLPPPSPTRPPTSMLPALLETLPPDLPACLVFHGEGVFDFPALVERFPMIPGAADRLHALGWKAGSFRQFSCEVPPTDGLNWVDMSVHEFETADSAVEAVPFFAYARTVGTQLVEAPVMRLGDRATAIGGPSELGMEYTLYVSAGRFLLRVTGIARDHDPVPDAELVMRALYLWNMARIENTSATQSTAPTVSSASEPQATAAPTSTPLPLPTSTPVPIPTSVPPAPTVPVAVANCDPSYPDMCIPPVWEVGDLDCKDVPYARFRVIGDDPHRLDGPYDGSIPNEPDGIGCEWN
jgi:hypothetical protein